ncbi:MAG TPA: glycosyltransferase [Candidatus Limnocylindria bacterium]|nr:glycosyltransferase [Candidatus Limnocylindria bacterium]
MISVVVPVYNEEENLPLLHARLQKTMASLSRPYEIIFVDDGSRDRSLEILKGFVGSPGVRVVELTRNYGQHPAVFSGFSIVRGDVVVTLDADLQNPPEEIPRLIQAMEEGGYEVVGSVRQSRHDSLFRKIPSLFVNAMTHRITGVQMTDWGCMLRVYRREVVDRMVASQEHSTFIPALATLYAKRVTEIPVGHEERHGGVSHYNLWKLIGLQFDLVTSFSEFPLKVLLTLGAGLSTAAALFGTMLFVLRVFYGAAWAGEGVFTLFAILFFFVGALFFAMGIMGQYVGRIYHEVRKRPSYTIRTVHEGTTVSGLHASQEAGASTANPVSEK